jgi:hypothetical protein
MTDPAIIEAASRELMNPKSFLSYDEAQQLVTAVLATATPLIRAAALEEAARVAEDVDRDVAGQNSSWSVGYFAQHIRGTAAAIRALKEQP